MERNSKSGVIGVIITIIILVLLVVFTNRNTENISTIENFANVVIVPIQNGLTYLKNKINNNDKFFENVNELKTENEELKQKNSELEKSLREFEVMKTENEQLKQQLNLAEKYGEYTTVPGTIISRDISNYSKTLVINIGSDNGVKENMTVIADEGLVGYIVSTTAKTAKIQTIVDSASSTSCLASTTRDVMTCKGTIESESTLKATNLKIGSNVIQGDSVETSGMGGIYTKGIHVGRIKKVETGTNKIDSYAVIETAVDFNKIMKASFLYMKKALIYISLIFVFIFIYLLQSVFFVNFTIAGVMPNIVVILALFIGLFIGRSRGIIYGIIYGIFMDLWIGKNIGITSVCLAIVGIIGGTFDKNFSKDSRIVILLIGAFCTIVYEVLLYVLQGVFFQISVEVIPFLKILALETIYNIFIIIIIYPIMKNVGYEIESEIKGDKILTRYF